MTSTQLGLTIVVLLVLVLALGALLGWMDAAAKADDAAEAQARRVTTDRIEPDAEDTPWW